MKTATTFHSDFFNTDCLIVDGQPHFSVSGATKTLYGRDAGSSIKGLASALAKSAGAQTPSSTADLSDLPGISPVLVFNGHMTTIGQAMSINTFVDLLDIYAQKNTKAGRYARETLRNMAKVSVDLKLKAEAGLLVEETVKELDESIAQFFKPIPGNEVADPINEIKELIIANGQKDRCKRMGVLVNELVYNRLPSPVYTEMVKRCGGWRRAAFKTNWQTLSTATQKRIEDILVVARVFIEDEMESGPIFNWTPVIQKLDRVMPRHRSSGYAAL